jgi:hypothetical protein
VAQNKSSLASTAKRRQRKREAQTQCEAKELLFSTSACVRRSFSPVGRVTQLVRGGEGAPIAKEIQK